MVLEIGKKTITNCLVVCLIFSCAEVGIFLFGNNTDVLGPGACAQHQSLSNACIFENASLFSRGEKSDYL